VILESSGKRPRIHKSAYVAPTATICGDVTVGENTSVLFGAIITADGGPVIVGRNCIIMENAVLRGTRRHPAKLGDSVLVGPHAYLSGCEVEDNVFLATGACIFNGARIGERGEVRINGVVHINTKVPSDGLVPIGWIAVGDPCKVLPPNQHRKIWAIQRKLNFDKTVWGMERAGRGQTNMPEIARRYTRALAEHKSDRPLSDA
jgi:carbonic anhydrase/acetyltransferase-like protein (isoleucine patch superfamily)